MKNIGQMMKQAQAMQQKLADMQARIAEVEKDGQSGGGMVVATLNGKGEARRIKIDKSLVDPNDVEVLEDLVIAAFNDAKKKVDDHIAGETEKMMGGLNLPPGMKLPF
jgi:DNA-binding YbaB/EbfC family protein